MFTTKIKVRFNHIDAAGIVFYPRNYEMLNQVVEEWFERALDCEFSELNGAKYKAGAPAVSINVEFSSPSHLGDLLDFNLTLDKLGNSSITLTIEAMMESELRIKAKMMLVYIKNENGVIYGPQRIPDELRELMLLT